MVKLLLGTSALGYPEARVEQTGLGALEAWGSALVAVGFKPAKGGHWRRRLGDGVALVAAVVPDGERMLARIGVVSVYADGDGRELVAFFCRRPEDLADFVSPPRRKAKT